MGTFTPVNELERLLIDAASDPAARPKFYRALPEHELFVITEGRKPEREHQITLTEETPLKLRMIELEGKLHIPIFTAVERISAVVDAEVGFVAMKGRDLLNLLRDKDLVMNPGSEYGKLLTQQEVNAIVDGSIFSPQETPDVGGKRVVLGQPNDYPRHITEALRRFFVQQREVKAAYLGHAFIPDIDKEPHTLIGIEVAGNWRRVVEEAGLVVREVAKAGEVVDFVQVHPGDTDTIGAYLQRETKPFYKRKLFGLF
ncbi:MAG: enhanced serine sensitivity protein SseB C-terminal domain-containing protein [Planctomycetes bacterium]|nr:enhanced serine sensitivity protein SseB C-terminal domain-containing protein [Planctomycetota bacterium]